MKVKRMKGKLTEQSIHVKGKWKAVELDPSVFSEEGLEGLVCFEELKSYRLMDPDKAAAKAVKQLQMERQKGKKRKAGKVVEGGEKAEDAAEPAKKKAKKKNKKKNKKLPSEEAGSSLEEVTETGEGAEGGEMAEEDKPPASEQSPKVTKKGKKQKNKKNQKQQNTADEELEEEPAPEPTPEPTPEAPVLTEEKPSQERVLKPAKKQVKNWTNATLSGSDEKAVDVSAWKDLFVPDEVLKALSSLGFGSPTPIQALALPSAIRDRMDILGAAETGSGKTLAFGIPMIHTILEWRKGAEDGVEAGAPVDSLYLPAADNDDENASDAEPEQEEAAAEKKGEQQEEEEMEEDEDEDDEDPGRGDSEDDASDGEDGDEKLGCVQVIEDVEFPQEEEEKMDEGSEKQPLLGLVLTPTRELAVQVKHHIDAVAKYTNIKTAIVVGGMAQQKQRRMLKRRPEIIIATPGRLWDLIKERHPHLLNLRQLRCLVIDEADRMVERGHFAELENLLEMLNTAHFNPKRQTFVFSATLTMVHSLPTRVLQKKKNKVEQRDKVAVLMEKVGIRSKPKVIDLTRKEATAETLTETQIRCQKEEKDFFLYYFLLQYPGRTMVFANSIDCIKRLNSLLVILDRTPLPLHANMHQKQRLKNLERFAEMDSCVLLTTDVAARGLDIPDVQHVIHYQVPRTSETYVHRSGRTARATKEGLSLLLIGPDDVMNFKKIYRTLGKDEDLPMFPIESKCLEAIKERVNLARRVEKIEFYNSRQKQHNSWFKQAAEAMDIDLDDDILLGKSRDEDDEREQQRAVKGMKKQLKHLVSQPVFKNVIKTKYPTQMGKLSLPSLPLATGVSALTRVSAQKEQNLQRKRQQQRKKAKQKKKTQQPQ